MRDMHAAGQAQRAAAAQEEIDMLNADPFDPEESPGQHDVWKPQR